MAPARSLRPNEFAPAPIRHTSTRCPFCGGNEEETPPAVAEYRVGDNLDSDNLDSAWAVRVVPNRFPAVAPLAGTRNRASIDQTELAPPTLDPADGDRRPAEGIHDVIIESREHLTSFAQLSEDVASLVFRAYRDRMRWVRQSTPLVYGQVFKNAGAGAGASIEHLHSQMLAIPYVPQYVAGELRGSRGAWQRTGRCPFCQLVEETLADRSRIVVEAPDFLAFCPFASRFPYEVWLLPRRHEPCFERTADLELSAAAAAIRDVVARLERVLDRPAYNWFLHTLPFDSTAEEHYHWHIEISPRLSGAAGFESGTGCFINAVPPEVAARQLREAG